MPRIHVTDPIAVGRSWTARHGHSGAVGYAPGRVNLIGEHLDYNGGPSLPIAIPYWTFVAAASSDRPGLTVISSTHGRYHDDLPASAERSPRGDWSDYVLGVVRSAGEHLDLPSGLALDIGATLPAGAGLSSSASLTIATALAVDRACDGPGLDRETVSRISRSAENDFVGAPTGDLDQCAILGARPDSAVLCRPGRGPERHVPWDPGRVGLRLLVVATGVRHSLSDGGYGARVAECAEAARALGAEVLADSRLDLGRITDPTLLKRARHVVTETQRVSDFADALDRDDLEATGEVLLGSHASLRDDYEVSCPELDLVVDTAMAHGALGARMTGGGFGGSAIVLTPQQHTDTLMAAITRAFSDEGLTGPTFLSGQAVGRASSFTA